MQVKNEIKTQLEQIYYFILYMGNLNGKFTNNELILLAKIMVLHPSQLTFETRATILEEMNIKKPYLSQLTTSLLNKGALKKQGYNIELAQDKHILIADKVKEDKEFKVTYTLSYD